MKFGFIFATTCLCHLLAFSVADAALSIPSILNDNMVLQQHKPIRIWGRGDAGVVVSVDVTKQDKAEVTRSGKSTADTVGNWLVELPSLDASSTQYTIHITAGNETRSISNVLVGEVWLASGQSNMQLPVQYIIGRDQILAEAKNPNLRCFHQDYGYKEYSSDPQFDSHGGQWIVADSGKNLAKGDVSGIGYTFAIALFDALNKDGHQIPVGLVNAATGSTSIADWMSKPAFDTVPQLRTRYPATWPTTRSDSGTVQFNYKLAPLVNLNIRGVIWSQGENDESHADYYRAAELALIRDWRTQFRAPEMPFIAAQLAPYPFRSPAGPFRQAQVDGCKDAGNAVAIPIYDFSLLWNDGPFKYKAQIHPLDKTPVGRRMALAARALAYGEKIDYQGPQFDRAEFKGGKITLHFTHIAGGLQIGTGGTSLMGFAMTGSDKKSFPADAVIVGDTVELTCPQVTDPVTASYAWDNMNHDANLFNSDKLPADPFQTRVESNHP